MCFRSKFLQFFKIHTIVRQLIGFFPNYIETNIVRSSFSKYSDRQAHKGDIFKDFCEDPHDSKPSGEQSI